MGAPEVSLFQRSAGILLPLFSLPSRFGIGDMGPGADAFLDFLEETGVSYWQILPLNPTNYGDSPYQSFSTFAGNPYFISPEILLEETLLTQEDLDLHKKVFCEAPDSPVDYGLLYENREKLLRLAAGRFDFEKPSFLRFLDKEKSWLPEYCLFMALKKHHGDRSFEEWEDRYRLREERALSDFSKAHEEDLRFYAFVQYEFFREWNELLKKAHKKGIRIIGDLPIYVAYDSADVWSHPEYFQLDEDLQPKLVAGCPPDAFSDTGQLWGNPLYAWGVLKKDHDERSDTEGLRKWWKQRLSHALTMADVIRLDHFRGFESYYAIPGKAKDARKGNWMIGPGLSIFQEMEAERGEKLSIIAEDLGLLTDEVREMLLSSGYPGMEVLQFAFDEAMDSVYLPHNHKKYAAIYTGTHDNDTVIGWASRPENKTSLELAKRYLHHTPDEGVNWTFMRAALMSVSDLCILTMQDLLGLGSEARINTPSTLGDNWRWRVAPGTLNSWLAGIIRDMLVLYGRMKE